MAKNIANETMTLTELKEIELKLIEERTELALKKNVGQLEKQTHRIQYVRRQLANVKRLLSLLPKVPAIA